MDVLNDELLRLWQALMLFDVQYIMIGGFATRFHGFNRSTEDLDLWLKDTAENRSRLRNALMDAGFGDLPQLETMQFVAGWTAITIGSGISLDILTTMKGLEGLAFEECRRFASVADIDGIKVPFLHISYLITNKKAIGRPKDLIDVMELERIRQLRNEQK